MRLAILIGIVVLGFSCKDKTTPASTSEPVKKEAAVDYAQRKYTRASVIDMSELSGCGFMLKLENGKKLQPTPALTEDYSVNDMDVWIKYQVKKGAVGICMSGQIVTIMDIQKRWISLLASPPPSEFNHPFLSYWTIILNVCSESSPVTVKKYAPLSKVVRFN